MDAERKAQPRGRGEPEQAHLVKVRLRLRARARDRVRVRAGVRVRDGVRVRVRVSPWGGVVLEQAHGDARGRRLVEQVGPVEVRLVRVRVRVS